MLWGIIEKSIEKEETIAEYVQIFNQISLSQTRYTHLNHKGKFICYRCRGHDILALNIEFEGFTSQHVRLWPSQKDKVYLMQKKKQNFVLEIYRN